MAPTGHAHFPKWNGSELPNAAVTILLDTYTYSTSDSEPAKTYKVRKIHSYNDLRKLPHTPFWIFCSSSSSVELAYRKSGTSTDLGFYMKRLLSLACVILDQENLRNFTQGSVIANFPYLFEAIFYMVTCIAFHRKVGLKRTQVRGSRSGWGLCENKQVGITLCREMDIVPKKN